TQPDPQAAAALLAQLQRRAHDLGASGVDPVYGYGVLGEELPLQREPGR
ncbi:peptidase S8, partial [Xanthomonas oryzae pv. oryzae]